MTLQLRPVTLSEANAFVAAYHRHSKPVVGHRWSHGVESAGVLVGVAIVGRPVARHMDDGATVEVLRVATDGTPNVCSVLLGAVKRAAWALGWTRIITYTLASESGASLRASGYRIVAEVRGRSWSCPSRPRAANVPLDRRRWEITP